MGPDDDSLLEAYRSGRSQEAFSSIVTRYLGLVCSSARRQVGDGHLAEDVAQSVFLTLARKAASLPPGTVLGGWLLATTRLTARNARVVRDRRARHEAGAAALAAARRAGESEAPREELEPELDEALARLAPEGRDALVLRYLEGKSLKEVAAALRISEEAAKQRVSRAVRRLRAALGRSGVAVSIAGLAAVLPSWGLKAAPPSGLAAAILDAAARLQPLPPATGSGAGMRWLVGSAAGMVLLVAVGLLALVDRTAGSPAGPGAVVYTVPGMDRVVALTDRSYRDAGNRSLWYDVYLPPEPAPADGWPVVVLIHGGPVAPTAHPKDWSVYRSYGRLLGASGLAAVTFNFRYASVGQLPEAAADLGLLLERLRTAAPELRIDPDRIGLWAFSGGGPQLAAAIRERPGNVRCLVSFYARLDAPSGFERYSPLAELRQAPGPLPPMLVARMGHDAPELNRSVDAFLEEARRRGDDVLVRRYEDGIHAFDIRQDTAEARELIAAAVAFVKEHLAAPGGRP